MIIASQKTTGGAFVPLTEQVLSPQKLLTEAIVAMGCEIDNRWEREHLSEGYIRKYVQEKKPLAGGRPQWLGDVIFQSRTLSDNVFDGKAPALRIRSSV